MNARREVWRIVLSSPSYEVSNQGRVRRRARGKGTRAGRERRLGRSRTGYLVLGLSERGKCRSYNVHRLVLETFCGLPAPGFEADHLNADRADNRLSNLEWVTKAENNRRAWRHRGRRVVGGSLQRPAGRSRDSRSRREEGRRARIW